MNDVKLNTQGTLPDDVKSVEPITTEEVNSSPSFWSRIDKKVLYLCICALTFVCWLCFHSVFFSILLILEALVVCAYFLYITAETDTVTLDSFTDGLKFIEPDPNGKLLKDLVIQEPSEELRDLADYVKNPEKFDDLGYHPETKILLFGDSGYGKSALIQAFANETNLSVIKVNGARFFDSEDVVEKIFELAKKQEDISYIVFIECFEKLLENASDSSDSSETVIDKLNTYLELYPNVILFATCESTDSIMSQDESYDSMFKKVIIFKLPKIEERKQLLKEFTENLNVGDDFDLDQFAKNCYGFTIGSLKYLVSKAASISRKHKHTSVQMSDFLEAFDILAFGQSDQRYNEKSRKIVAYHESGHALVHYLKKGSKDLLRVISISRGDSGGLTFFDPNFENVVHTEEDLLTEICVAYGGRCAEQLIFNHLSTGAQADIQHATYLITNMLTQYGMSEALGPVNYATQSTLLTGITTSPFVQDLIAKERMEISKKCAEETLQLLKDNQDKLEKLATYLMDNESITGEELDALLKAE